LASALALLVFFGFATEAAFFAVEVFPVGFAFSFATFFEDPVTFDVDTFVCVFFGFSATSLDVAFFGLSDAAFLVTGFFSLATAFVLFLVGGLAF
jgi:hypothetical protein